MPTVATKKAPWTAAAARATVLRLARTAPARRSQEGGALRHDGQNRVGVLRCKQFETRHEQRDQNNDNEHEHAAATTDRKHHARLFCCLAYSSGAVRSQRRRKHLLPPPVAAAQRVSEAADISHIYIFIADLSAGSREPPGKT
jgi:hypothetical protein